MRESAPSSERPPVGYRFHHRRLLASLSRCLRRKASTTAVFRHVRLADLSRGWARRWL